jgi:hypothetical protein
VLLFKIIIFIGILISLFVLLVLLVSFAIIDSSYINYKGMAWDQTGKFILSTIVICFLLILLFVYT